jgi:hypothetical protein
VRKVLGGNRREHGRYGGKILGLADHPVKHGDERNAIPEMYQAIVELTQADSAKAVDHGGPLGLNNGRRGVGHVRSSHSGYGRPLQITRLQNACGGGTFCGFGNTSAGTGAAISVIARAKIPKSALV